MAETRSGDADSLDFRSNFSGHIRSLFMATDNTGSLPDYYAWGVGGKLQYALTYRHRWEVGLAAYHGTRLLGHIGSTDGNGRASRYEKGLIDVANPEKSMATLLGMAYMAYHGKNLKVKAGRMSIETPIVNSQDSRFIPTLVQGLWVQYDVSPRWSFQSALITHIAPRSTVHFYTVANSIGRTSLGKTLTGERAAYRENVATSGIGILGVDYHPHKDIELRVWEYYVPNVFNSLHAELISSVRREDWNFLGKAQYIFQTRLGDGGNADPGKTYFSNEKPTHVFSSSAGVGYRDMLLTFNFTRIADKGRFLYPREWGGDDVYTPLSRERDEGSADTYEYMLQIEKKISLGKWKGMRWYGAYGIYQRPDMFCASKNKYEIPAYHQMALFLSYPIGSALAADLLLTRKMNLQKDILETDKFNKVDMNHIALKLEYSF